MMSKYSRTRKAICRINKSEDWWVSRAMFKTITVDTWKQTYKKYKKDHIRKFGKNLYKLPNYKEALKTGLFFKLPGIEDYD